MKYYKNEKPQNLEEKTKKTEQIFNGGFIKVYRDEIILPDQTEDYREYITHPGAAVMIPVLSNGNLIMVEQYRYPLKKVFLEFPAGKRDPQEVTSETAIRELKEEVGCEAKKWTYLTQIHPAIGYCNEFIDIYVAEEMNDVGYKRDEGEFLNLVEISLDEALDLLDQGQMTDVKTVAALLFYSRWKNRQSSK